MSKRENRKNSQEYVLKAVPTSFMPVPTRGGHSFDLIAEAAIEVVIDGKTEQVLVSIRRGTPQFNPSPGKQYLCDVKLRCNAGGKWSGRATPSRDIIPLLSEKEWNSDLRDALTVRLTFRRGNGGRPIAFFDGNPVFSARGSEVVMGQPRTYLLLQKDGFAYSAVLLDEAPRHRDQRTSNATSVDVCVPVAKGASPQSEEDLDYRTERKSIGDLLGISSDDATEQSVREAAERKLKALGLGKAKPFILQRMTEEFAKAIEEAREKALAILAEQAEQAPPAMEQVDVEPPEALTDGIVDADTDVEDEAEEGLDTLVAE